MKKKITAALLVLCMVLGMLPLTALAEVGDKFTIGSDTTKVWEVTKEEGDKITLKSDTDTVEYYRYGDVDSYTYYALGDVNTPVIFTPYTEEQTDAEKAAAGLKAIEDFLKANEADIIELVVDGSDEAGTGEDAAVVKAGIEAYIKANIESEAITLPAGATYAVNVKTINLPTTEAAGTLAYTVTVTVGEAPATSAADITVTLPKKTAQEFTITFNWNYGETPATEEKTTVNGIVTAPANVPEREGYKFLGWGPKADSTEEDAIDLTKEVFKGDTELFALWATEAKIEVEVTVAGSTEAPIVSVSEDKVTETVTQITEVNNDAEIITVDLNPTNETTKNTVANAPKATVTVPATIVEALKAKLTDAAAKAATAAIEFPKGSIEITSAVVGDLGSGALELTITTESEDLTAPAAAEETVKEVTTNAKVEKVISIDLKVGNTAIDSSNQLSEEIKVSVNISLDIDPAKAAVWYLPGAGAAPVRQNGAKYGGGIMSWMTRHCSEYAFGETTISTDEDPEVEDITPSQSGIGLSFAGTGTANQQIVYDVKGEGSVHTILYSTVKADGSWKVETSSNIKSIAIWVANSITWDADKGGFVAAGEVSAYEWEA